MTHKGTGIAWRDLLFMLVLIFAFFASFEDPDKKSEQIESPGNIIVAIRWPNDYNDVDLWIRNPLDKGVGYSAKDGELFNLVRDDIGKDTDLSGSNFETSFSRGIPDGEYIVNLHCYSCLVNTPVPVTVSVKYTLDGKVVDLLDRTFTLLKDDQELTAIRFKMKNGKVIPESINDIYQPIFKDTRK